MKKLSLVGPVILIMIWSIVSLLGIVDTFFLPSPWVTLNELWSLLYQKNIFVDIYTSLYRVAFSFIFSAFLGIVFGMILGSSEKLYRSVEFLIDFFRGMAAQALIPLFMLIFGIGDVTKISVATFTATIVVIFNVAYGIMHTKKTRRLAAKIMGATKMQIFKNIILWESLPQTFVGLRVSLSWIMAVVIASEMFIGSTAGLGYKIVDFQITYNIPAVYATILIVGFMGYFLNLIFVNIERRFLHWSLRV